MKHKTYKQHFIPRTYLRQWCTNNKVYVTDVNNEKTYHRNVSKLFLIEHIYSITLNEFSLIEDSIKYDFLDVLDEYIVYYNGEKLDKSEILDTIMYYDSFQIKKGDKIISKKAKEDLLEKLFNNYSDILEEKYAQYENKFAKTIFLNDENIFQSLLNNVGSYEIISDIYLFAQQLYIRNPYIIMFHANRSGEKIEKNDFKRLFKRLQIEGFNHKNLFTKGLNLRFLYNQTNEKFVTSDIPVILDLCDYCYENNVISGKFLLILSPNIAVIFFSQKDKTEQFYELCSIDINGVEIINKKIKESCSSYYVSCNKPNDTCFINENDSFNFYNYNCRGIFKLINEQIK